MATLRCSTSASASCIRSASPRCFKAPASTHKRPSVTAHASVKGPLSDSTATRRDTLAGAAVTLATLISASPASAFLGIGEEGQVLEGYQQNTEKILGQVRTILDTPKDDPKKEEMVKELRKDINSWVAAYRREDLVAGKPSFGLTYSVLNALAGHVNSFGPTTPIPKKRLDRIEKELKDANIQLSRKR